MYQIVETAPMYHFSTDAFIGNKEMRRSHGYLTLALAHKLAAMQAEHDYNRCGDNSFVVVPFGGSAFADAIPQPVHQWDDLVF